MEVQKKCNLRNAAIIAALLIPGGGLALLTVALVRAFICPQEDKAATAAGEAVSQA